MALAKAARLAQQRAGEGSPSSEEARDLNAQLEAASRTRLSDVGTERDHPDTGATDMLSPPARSSMLSPSVGCSSRRKKSPAVRWSAAVEPSPAAAAKKPPEIVESVAVVRGPQTPVQQDSAMAVGGSLSPSPSGKWWREMREEEHAAAVLMGWDEKSWDAGDRAPFKAVWSEMGELRQRAAMIFKFGPEHFAKPTKVHTWAGHDGWTYKRGSGLVTFLYIAPDGRVFTSERDAQQAYDVSQGHSPRGSAVSDSDSESSQQQASKPSPPHRSPARSPILSPKSSKLAQATETDSQDAGAYWANMNKLQQTAAEMLGWSSQSWDDGDDTPFRKVWVEMTDDEHSAALMLNFEQEHFAKPKKPKDKKGKAWPEHEGWWIRRGTGLINWIYTGPDGTEYTDEQEALQAADAAADDSDLMAETFCEDQTDFDRGIDGCGSRRERVEPKHGVKQQHADSFTSPLPSAATAGEDSAAAQPSPKAVGDFVEANYMGLGTFHGGVIKTQHPDGTFAVAYHDGDYEENVERANIRALRKRRRVPRTDLDINENAVASRERAVAAKAVAASREKAKPEKAKPKKATPKPAPPRGPTAAQRKRVAQALRKAAESVAECSDRSIAYKLGWLWTALVGYKSAEESVSGMDLLQHISSSGSEQGTADLGARRHSALFSPSENRRGAQRGAATPAGTPHSAQHNEKAFMWERLDGKTWRQLPDGNTWQRDGLVVLWTPCTALTKTLPELDKLVFELKCNGKSVNWFSGASGEVRQGRQGKEECFVVITEAQLRECGEGVGEVLVWNSDGTPDPNNDSGIKLEDTMTGLPLDGVAAEASQGASAEDASFPPTSGLQVDMICDAQDTAGGWNPVRIKALREDTDGVKQVKVHFLGWNERHDKWMSITAGQLAPAGTMSTDAESSSRHRWNGRRESSSGLPDAPVGVKRAMEFEEEVLEIAQIVQARQSEPEDGGGMQYKIRYKGSGDADDIWVAEDELAEMGARDKLNKFHEGEKKKAEKKAAIVSPCPVVLFSTQDQAPGPCVADRMLPTHYNAHACATQENKKMADAKRKADLERRKEQQRLKKELLEVSSRLPAYTLTYV